MNPSSDATDREQELAGLIQLCAGKDARALERLYRLTSPVLFGCLMRMLRRRALAEEALQEVFVSIWQRAGQYQRARGNVLAWMTTIARYRAIDLLRHERGAPLAMADLPDLPEVNDEPSAVDALAAPPDTIERCMRQLSGEQQRCLQFAFVNGRSHQEISQLTGNPLGTVKSWIRRGLFSLRECLEA
jgi:RNA polymerase sigma-70 factor (ECF subfamily)